MKQYLYKCIYSLAYGFWFLLSLLPFRVLYAIADVLYLLIKYVVRYRHKVIWKNLTESFPEKTAIEIKQIQSDFYRWFCDYLVETIKLMSISSDTLRKRMQFKNIETMQKVIEEGGSCALYLGHYCNWEWITSIPLWLPREVQCCQLYHPLQNPYFDKLFKYVRERKRSYCIPMQESLRKIMEYKQKNASIAVGYIADQSPLWWNMHHWVDFLNHDTPVLTGAERIIKHTKQACFYGEMKRVKRGYYVCDVKTMTLTPEKHQNFEITDIYFRMLEATIRQAPAYWLWSHNRWKRTREDFNRNWEVVGGKVVRKKNEPQNDSTEKTERA